MPIPWLEVAIAVRPNILHALQDLDHMFCNVRNTKHENGWHLCKEKGFWLTWATISLVKVDLLTNTI